MKKSAHFAPLLLCLLASSCAKHPTNPQDPYEPLNRNIFKFNNCVDHTLYRPVAKVYHGLVPNFVQNRVSNFFDNLEEPMSFTNDILQGKFRYAGLDFVRLLVNTTAGIAGLFDVAAKMGLPKHYNSFPNTFAYYSDNKKSPYLVIPFLGPSTFRDAFGLPFNIAAYPLTYVNGNAIFYGTTALYYINLRSRLLEFNKLLDGSFDPYAAMRNAYLTTRNRTIAKLEKGDYVKGQTDASPLPENVNSPDDDYTFD